MSNLRNRKWNKNPIIGNPAKAEYLKYDRLVGIEIECSITNGSAVAQKLPQTCGITDDVSSDKEFQTPPCSADKLEQYIGAVCSALDAGDAAAEDTDGLHIHLDGVGFADEQTNAIRLANTYWVLEPILYAILAPNRRRNRFCPRLTGNLSKEDFRQMLRTQSRADEYYLAKKWYKRNINDVSFKDMRGNKYPLNGIKRYGFNLHALFALGHLELRYHAGTVNPHKIRNWVWLNLHILDWVQNHYSKKSIVKIRNTRTITGKINKFCELFNVPPLLEQYILYRRRRCGMVGYRERHDDDSYTDAVLMSKELMDAELKKKYVDKGYEVNWEEVVGMWQLHIDN